MAKSVKCLLGLHRWHIQRTEDGDKLLACSRCGRIGEVGPDVPMDMGL